MIGNKKLLIAVAMILLIGISVGAYYYLFSASAGEAEVERIVINLNITEQEIVSQLKEQGYIRSDWIFNFVLSRKGWQGEIKPGAYMVSKSMNVWELADILVNQPYQRWVAIPEGLRKEEIAEIIKKKLAWTEGKKEELLNNAQEGYLFPDTYLLNIDYTAEEVVERMENKFNEKVADIFAEAKANRIRNDSLIVLASLVQREAGNKEQMPLIAGILWNRWLADMKFEIDATVQYALGEPGNWWPKIRPEDYKTGSPYNTYLHKGRPPAPICSPGLAAIDSVVHDQSSDYFYYLHDSEGRIYPAETYEEHLENIEKYLR